MIEIPKNYKPESEQDEASICAAIESAFSPEHYIANYPEIRISGEDPLLHYVRRGWKEGRNPSKFFSTSYYLGVNKDVVEAGINPLFHYVTSGLQEGRRPLPLPQVYESSEAEYQRVRTVVGAVFDSEFYAGKYPESLQQMRDPLDHFLIIGWMYNLDPAPWFSVSSYLQEHEDIRTSGVNPFFHYLTHEQTEGRSGIEQQLDAASDNHLEQERLVLQDKFDSAFYLHVNTDVQAAGTDPLEHYLQFGWKEGRDPTPDFSTTYYLRTNPDVEAKGINPFYHYLVAGRKEGRHPVLPGGYASQALYSLTSLEQQVAESRQREGKRAREEFIIRNTAR